MVPSRAFTTACKILTMALFISEGGASTLPLACDEELELMQNLKFIQTTCAQAGESFSDNSPIPSTCATFSCKYAVDRVFRDCGPLLASSGWYETRLKVVQAAAGRCVAASLPATDEYFVADPPIKPIEGCEGVLSDGHGDYGANWRRAAVIDAGPGMKAQLRFNTLNLAEGDFVSVFDGQTNDFLIGTKLKGTKMPAHTFVSSGRFLYVEFTSDVHETTVASGFVANITCTCADSAEWKDSAGNSCDDFRSNPLFAYCEGSLPAEGTVPYEGHATGFLPLAAKEACPRACQACGLCANAPCQNQGTCTELAAATTEGEATADGGSCPGSEMQDRTAQMNKQCCGADDTTCNKGTPTSWYVTIGCERRCLTISLSLCVGRDMSA
eukprot:COSAG05_NODE_4671_length_1416_cov_2.463174_1_plen_383_part_01